MIQLVIVVVVFTSQSWLRIGRVFDLENVEDPYDQIQMFTWDSILEIVRAGARKKEASFDINIYDVFQTRSSKRLDDELQPKDVGKDASLYSTFSDHEREYLAFLHALGN